MFVRMLRVALIGAAVISTCAPQIAAAQAFDGYPFGGRSRGYNPHEGLQRNGCVKWCEFDNNPCDPPQFKTADGRCAYDR